MNSAVTYGLEFFWYIIIMVAIANYAMLDGFDLGVGMLAPFAKKDEHRRLFLNAIGPVWDGNEVWLIVVMGGLFAGFPIAYATLLSSYNTPVIIIVFALIFRAVAIEFRSKRPMLWWREMWDILFAVGSLVIAFGVGCALGNFVEGIPLNQYFEYQGGIMLTFLRPYPVLMGIMTVGIFCMHGAIYLVMKTEGEIQERIKRWVPPLMIFFIIIYFFTTMATLVYQDHIVARFKAIPWFFIIAIADTLIIANIPREITKGNYGWGFISSCLNILLLVALFACGMFPDLIRSSIDPANNSVTITNSASSQKTMTVLLIIVCIGIPLVLAYMSWVYHIFRGKVRLDDHSY